MIAARLVENLMTDKIALAQQVNKADSNRWITIGDVVILTCTLLGATAILLSMFILEFVRGRPGTTRTRIVQALIFSDFILGICGLASSSTILRDPQSMQHGTSNCSGLGFMFVVILWTEHLWTLTLAFATFMILIYPLHLVTMWLEKRWYYLWAIVWLCAITVGILGLELYGYYPSGGVCYYGDNAGLYAELIQFIPRAIVCLCITGLYARLFVFLRRPDKIRIPGSNSFTNATVESDSTDSSGPRRRSSRFGSWIPNAFRRPTIVGTEADEKVVDDPINMDSMEPAQQQARKSSLAIPTTSPLGSGGPGGDDLAPWERLELPPFQINGERYGGGTSTPGGNSTFWGGWKGMGTRKRQSTTSSFSSPRSHPTSRMGSTSQPTAFESHPMSIGAQLSPPFNKLQSIPSADQTRLASPFVSPSRRNSASQSQTQALSEPGSAEQLSRSERIARMSIPIPNRGDVSPPYDQVSPLCTPTSRGFSPVKDVEPRRSSAVESLFSTDHSRQSSGQPLIREPRQTTSFSAMQLRNNSLSEAETGASSTDPLTREEEGEEGEWDLLRMLAHVPAGSRDERFAPPEGERIELVPESMASYLNRKTALLMLWFPLGYVFLFSVSLIRLIYDFVGNPPPALRAVSRWMVLSQGLLDAVIYGLVEWHTKRVVRKKVRRGTFSPRHTGSVGEGSGLGARMGNAASMVRNLGSKMSGGRVLSQQSGGGVGTTSKTGITSFPGVANGRGGSQPGSKRGSIIGPYYGQGQWSSTGIGMNEDTPRGSIDASHQDSSQEPSRRKVKHVFVQAPGEGEGDTEQGQGQGQEEGEKIIERDMALEHSSQSNGLT